MSHNGDLIVGLVMKDEADSGVPHLLELQIHQPLLGAGVVPHGHVGIAVGVGWRRTHLNVGHTAVALELVVGVTKGKGVLVSTHIEK